MQTLRFRAVIYPEDGLWMAYALEINLIGTGATEAVAVVISIGDCAAMLKRLGEMEKPTDFSSLRDWRKNAGKNRKAGTADLSDRHQHLDEKCGS